MEVVFPSRGSPTPSQAESANAANCSKIWHPLVSDFNSSIDLSRCGRILTQSSRTSFGAPDPMAQLFLQDCPTLEATSAQSSSESTGGHSGTDSWSFSRGMRNVAYSQPVMHLLPVTQTTSFFSREGFLQAQHCIST